MKRSVLIIAAIMLSALMLLLGCAKSSEQARNYYPSSPEYSANEGRTDSAYKDPMNGGDSPSAPIETDPLINRKIIRNASLNIETLDFDNFVKSINEKAAALGGYIQSNVVRNTNYYRSYKSSTPYLRGAEMVFRIPAEKLDEFLAAADGLGNVTSRSETVSDVTENYVDVEARLKSLRTEYDTLLELLSRAENLEEIIMLQDRLTNVRYEIESYEARLRSYDSQIAFSTVSINLTEVERETAVTEESFGEETSRRFRESLEDVGEGFRDFAAWFIGNLPHIVVVLLLVVCPPLVIVLIIVGSVKRRRKKRKALLEAKAAEEKKE